MSLGLVLGYIVFLLACVVAVAVAAVVMQMIHRRHRFPINNDNPAIRLTVFAAIVLPSWTRHAQAGPVSGGGSGGRSGGRFDRHPPVEAALRPPLPSGAL